MIEKKEIKGKRTKKSKPVVPLAVYLKEISEITIKKNITRNK